MFDLPVSARSTESTFGAARDCCRSYFVGQRLRSYFVHFQKPSSAKGCLEYAMVRLYEMVAKGACQLCQECVIAVAEFLDKTFK